MIAALQTIAFQRTVIVVLLCTNVLGLAVAAAAILLVRDKRAAGPLARFFR